MASFADIFLHIAFRLTRSRAVSERIQTRRMAARFAAREARMIANGGHVITIKNQDGEQSFFVEAGKLQAFFGREA